MWHTMILFVASQVSRVCFQIQKSDNLHGCNIMWLTNVMLMVTTVHCTNAPSRVWIFNSKTSVNRSWALHRPPHPHKGCSCHGDTRAVNGMKGDTATHCQGPKVRCPSHPLLSAPPHSSGTVQPCPTCTSTHSRAARKRGEELQRNRHTAPTRLRFLQPATHSSCQWGHSKNFHKETPRPTEGFTNKVTKISKHIPTLSFSHELSGNIYGAIPSYLWNKAIFIYRRHRGGEKVPKKPSNWKDCSQMEPWKITS